MTHLLQKGIIKTNISKTYIEYMTALEIYQCNAYDDVLKSEARYVVWRILFIW